MTDHWEQILELRDRQRAERGTGLQVVHEDDLPLETSRQGQLRWYLHPAVKNTVLNTLLFYSQELAPGSRSGRVKCQGGQAVMFVEGKGYTLLDGVRHEWQAGDVLNLPMRRGGIIFQHFNPHDEPAKFVVAEMNWLDCCTVDRGSGFEQLEDAPEFAAAQREAKQHG